MRIRRVGDFRCKVGEGPLWDERAQCLYFVDLVGQRLCRLDPADDSFSEWAMPETIAAVALTDAGGIVVALADAFYSFDPSTRRLERLAGAALAAGTQFNDGKVDREGRFVGVSMERTMKQPSAGVFRLENGAVDTLDGGYVIGNGPCWSVDGLTFYCSDSVPKKIYAYDYRDGRVDNRREFADTTVLGGIPDGATVDEDGRLWMAICGGGKIAAFTADGVVERVIEMPTPWVSSVMFGGPLLDRIYVPSLDPTLIGLPADEKAGYLYVIEDLGVRGLVEPRVRI